MDGTVVNEVKEVLEVWQTHFATLGTPKKKLNFDEDHFRLVTNSVREYNEGHGLEDIFLNKDFSSDEISDAIKTLNLGKAARPCHCRACQIR